MSFTNQELQIKHSGYNLFMTSDQLSKIASSKKGMILDGVFTEDLTHSAIALAKSFTEYQDVLPLFEHHWGYVNTLTSDQLTEIVIPHVRVKLNVYLCEFNSHHKARLIEYAKAYELCNTRLLALKASK